MNTKIARGADCYIGFFENNPVVFFAVLHFPHPRVKNFKRGHRLVVLPDYQGLGIGHIFSSYIASIYKKRGFRFRIVSSTRALYYQRSRSKEWAVVAKSRNMNQSPKFTKFGFGTPNKYTYSYEYLGQNG